MPATSRREDLFINLFMSAYEDASWADAVHVQPDKIERTKPAVDWFAKRACDGDTVAIEHTIIEPFVEEKRDFAFFETAFLGIEREADLAVAGRWIQVFVPVGTLRNQHDHLARSAIVKSVHEWIKANRLVVPNGKSQHRCAVARMPDDLDFAITLDAKVVPLQHGSYAETGVLHVRRQQVEDSLADVLGKALGRKLPKLVNTAATRRILLLERQHMNLRPTTILREIEKQRASFPQLAQVDEIWILETILYGTAFGGTCLRFELYENGEEIKSFDFSGGRLVMSSAWSEASG
jgi:hypothetical protein